MTNANLNKDPLNAIITGVGGQGNVLMAQLFGKALTDKGFIVTVGDTYGAAQRGGPVSSHLRISKKTVYSPLTPGGQADLVISLEPVEALRVLGVWGNPAVVVVSNTRPSYPFDVTSGSANYPTLEEIKSATDKLSRQALFVDASEIALQMGAAVLTNTIMSGIAVGLGLFPIIEDDFIAVLKEQFTNKKYELNLQAFQKGLEIASKNKKF
jgi:indolepyruvate ferredoxin oxidoreductase beta subunit